MLDDNVDVKSAPNSGDVRILAIPVWFTDSSDFFDLTKKDSVKFVCGSLNDMERAYEIITKYDLIQKTNCLFSPVFGLIDLKDMVQFLIDKNLNGVRLCLQIHKIIWDPNERGV